MATDPIPVRRRYDQQSLSEAVQVIAEALNLGGRAINKAVGPAAVLNVTYPLRSLSTTVLSLPTPSDAGRGARAIVSDATVTHKSGVGDVVEGGGSNVVPVYSDGDYWLIG